MKRAQPGILASLPQLGRYLTFDVRVGASAAALRALLEGLVIDEGIVVGLGASTLQHLGVHVEGLRPFLPQVAGAVDVPSTPAGLWVWLRAAAGEDRGDVAHRSRHLVQALQPGFVCRERVDAFQHKNGHDLSGYEDGTENPTGDEAVNTALIAQGTAAQGSFVSVQRWVHDLQRFETFTQETRDNIIGRRLHDNVELEAAPLSAHVKRTAQEDFVPEAFVVRRSMPWASAEGEGLMFVAFGHTLDAFEAQLARMCGLDDGIVDGLFSFTRPVTGAHFFCPAVKDGRLHI